MEYRLKLGEVATVFPLWWGTNWSLTCCGMLSDGVVSVAVQWSMGHNSAAYNLFLSPETRPFALPVGRVSVTSRSPSEIGLRFERT